MQTNEDEMNVTELDKALQAARENEEKGADYLNLLLNCEVFVPVWNEIVPPENETDSVNINPVITENENNKCIMAFDTQEKLEAWSDQTSHAASMRGYDLFMMVKEAPVLICVNAGTEYIKLFERPEIEWIIANSNPAPVN